MTSEEFALLGMYIAQGVNTWDVKDVIRDLYADNKRLRTIMQDAVDDLLGPCPDGVAERLRRALEGKEGI